MDDGPGADGVVAVDTRYGGEVRVLVEGLSGRDTEGLATGRCDPAGTGRCLYIGDIGNNQRLWPSVDVWRVREPRLDARSERVRVDGERATYTYPDAPADAEALLVADGRPFLVTKERRDPASGRAPPPRLLAAPRWGDAVPALQQAEGLAVDRCGLWLVSERDRFTPDDADDAAHRDGAQRPSPRAPLWLVPRTSARSDDDEEQACPTGDAPS
ncbi:MAG: hypothetical protein KY460_03420 [Actinobacteria bacterium]|nr:hypothetical protein [Actinomycetota bacterium]